MSIFGKICPLTLNLGILGFRDIRNIVIKHNKKHCRNIKKSEDVHLAFHISIFLEIANLYPGLWNGVSDVKNTYKGTKIICCTLKNLRVEFSNSWLSFTNFKGPARHFHFWKNLRVGSHSNSRPMGKFRILPKIDV